MKTLKVVSVILAAGISDEEYQKLQEQINNSGPLILNISASVIFKNKFIASGKTKGGLSWIINN